MIGNHQFTKIQYEEITCILSYNEYKKAI
jgi:hypothetical protein